MTLKKQYFVLLSIRRIKNWFYKDIKFKNDINRKQFCSTVIWWFPFIFPQMPTAGKNIIGLWLIVLAALNLSQGK